MVVELVVITQQHLKQVQQTPVAAAAAALEVMVVEMEDQE